MCQIHLKLQQVKLGYTCAFEEEFPVNGQKIEYVAEYSYLEQTISFVDRATRELKIRASKAWETFERITQF